MNKTSQPKSQTMIRTVITFTLCILASLAPIQTAKADISPPPDPAVGGVVPYQPQKTNVQMMAETVFIDVLPRPPLGSEKPKQVRVDASFTMRNQGQTEEQMQVFFPLANLDPDGAELNTSNYGIDGSSFIAKVNGQPVPITQIRTPSGLAASYDEVKGETYGFNWEIQWAAFDVTFPIHRDVLIEVQYDMLEYYQESSFGFTGIAYVLETGAGWYGNILSADITLRLPYSATEESIVEANSGYIISGNEMHWNIKNFEPTREDNIEVQLFRVDVWQTILELRSKVEQDPADSESWAELGDRYMRYAIFAKERQIHWVKPHFLELALEARQKVIALRPEWGDAHYKLAESLWFSNPSVQNQFGFNKNNTIPDLHLDDPAVQQMLHELEQAWTLGVTEDTQNYVYFTNYIQQAFPELKLGTPVPPTITLAPSIARITPGSNQTEVVLPTDLPTSIPTVLPTPISTEASSSTPFKVWIVVILGLAINLGIIVYRAKSMSRDKK